MSPSLPELQARFSAALLAGDEAARALPAAWFGGGRPVAESLAVHRNTVLAALANALRMDYPATDRLVGEAFFDRMAVEYSRAHPPMAPQLDLLGAGFARWAGGFPGTEAMPWLAELARFEWQLAELSRTAAAPAAPGRMLEMEGGVRLEFAASLRLLRSPWPVDAIRAGVLDADLGALRAATAQPRTVALALWRGHEGVRQRELDAAAAAFLEGVLAGEGSEAALDRAARAQGAGDAAALMQQLAGQVLGADFVTIRPPAAG